MKKKIGRPTKYNENTVVITREYYQECLDTDIIPYVESLQRKLDIDYDTVIAWSDKYLPFSQLIKKIKDLQKNRLQEVALGQRKGNVIGAIFLLKVNHGFIETQKSVVQTDQPHITFDMSGGFVPPIDVTNPLNKVKLDSPKKVLDKPFSRHKPSPL